MPGSFRNYGKIDPYLQFQHQLAKRKEHRRIIIIVASSLLLLIGVVCLCIGLFVSHNRRNSSDPSSNHDPQLSSGSKAIQAACNTTLFPDVCTQTLTSYPGSLSANPLQLVTIAVEVAMAAAAAAYNLSLVLSNEVGNSALESMALQDCAELMDSSTDRLNASISSLSSLDVQSLQRSLQDVEVWLSAASSDQTACTDGLENFTGSSTSTMVTNQVFVSEVMLNALSLVETLSALGSDLSSWKNNLPSLPDIFHLRRRLLSEKSNFHFDRPDTTISAQNAQDVSRDFPNWVSPGVRKLLQTPSSSVQANITVSLDGKGDYKTLTDALDNVPKGRSDRFVIYIKQGNYAEGPIKIGKDLANVTLIGDGCNKTVITGTANVASGNYTTFRSATLGIAAVGFMAKDLTFRNEAGPNGHQAVALRAGGDYFVFDSCCFEGYQDTLYALSGRQFYWNCKVFGTVDFIFGNAIAVFQNSELAARQPLLGQQNTYTAQGRTQNAQRTGFSFQNCNLTQADDLKTSTFNVTTYLGRPWKAYSTSVFLQSYIGGHVDPAGWLAWNTSNPFENTCYYAEYENTGPGSNTNNRVSWECVRREISSSAASTFTVESFISGNTWIPQDVAFSSGLST